MSPSAGHEGHEVRFSGKSSRKDTYIELPGKSGLVSVVSRREPEVIDIPALPRQIPETGGGPIEQPEPCGPAVRVVAPVTGSKTQQPGIVDAEISSLAVQTRLCLGLKRDGGVCKMTPTRSGFCYRHDPNTTDDELAVAAHRGGVSRGRQQRVALPPPPAGEQTDPPLDRPEQIRAHLQRVAGQLARREISAKDAQAQASIARAAAQTLSGDLLAKLEALEEVAERFPDTRFYPRGR